MSFRLQVSMTFTNVAHELFTKMFTHFAASASHNDLNDHCGLATKKTLVWVHSINSLGGAYSISGTAVKKATTQKDLSKLPFLSEGLFNMALSSVEIRTIRPGGTTTQQTLTEAQRTPRGLGEAVAKAVVPLAESLWGVDRDLKREYYTNVALAPAVPVDSDIVKRALTKFGEEAAEVTQEVFKCLRFGTQNTDPRVDKTNLEKLEIEMAQMNMLYDILRRVMGKPYSSDQVHTDEYKYQYNEIMTGIYVPRKESK